jgi:hypothetical protein
LDLTNYSPKKRHVSRFISANHMPSVNISLAKQINNPKLHRSLDLSSSSSPLFRLRPFSGDGHKDEQQTSTSLLPPHTHPALVVISAFLFFCFKLKS